MRKIIGMMKDLRLKQLSEGKATNTKLAEVGGMFDYLNNSLDGIKPTDTNTQLSEVMTSADFTYAIMEFVQRQIVPGYTRKTFNFEPLVKMDTVPNFLPVTRYQNRAGVDDLEYVAEKGQPRPGSVDDATKRQYRVYRFEKQYDFSYEALVNDDLGYFQDLTTKMGEAARRTLEKYVSRFYTNAVSIARLVGLGALYAQNGRLTSARISDARMAFNQRTDARGEPISAALGFIVGHRGLADVALQIQNSELVPELATNASNIVKNFQWIEDPYIVGAAPNLPWYGFVDYTAYGITPFVLARRQNMPGPMIWRKRSDIESVTSILGPGASVNPIFGDFASRNIVLMITDEWGTYIDGTEGNLFDFRGAYYSTGTAP